MKNIDRIKQMSPVELAVFIAYDDYCSSCTEETCERHLCYERLRQWLDEEELSND